MTWITEKRAFWTEREDLESGKMRNADCRILFGPLNLYWWHWRHHRVGPGLRYSFWRQVRAMRRRRLGRWGFRGPLLIKNGHPWGIRLRWSWRGWSAARPPWEYNVWTMEPVEVGTSVRSDERDAHDGASD